MTDLDEYQISEYASWAFSSFRFNRVPRFPAPLIFGILSAPTFSEASRNVTP
jgi:hypothetical protein